MAKSNHLDRLTAASDKISANKYLQGISQGVMTALPFIIVGAFGSLFLGLPIQPWQDFIAATGLSGCLNMAVNATTNMLGVIITIPPPAALRKSLRWIAKSSAFSV